MTLAPRAARAVVLAAVFVCAACGLIYELALVALGSYLLGSAVTTTSLVLSVVLCAMGLGALAAKPLTRWPVVAFAGVEVALALIGGLAVPALYASFAYLGVLTGGLLAVAAAIGALIGAEIPLLMRLVQRIRAQDASDAVADLSAADYVGALVGGLAFPFLLLPLLGLMQGVIVVGAVNLAAAGVVAGWLFRPSLRGPARAAVTGSCLAAALVLGLASTLAADVEVTLRQALYAHPIIHVERSAAAEVVVTAAPRLRGERDVRLFLNGDLQFSSLDEHRYHEALVHPAMAAGARSVLVLGGGDGLAVREVLRHPDVERVVLVDLDPAVTELARSHPDLLALNDGALDDPRVEVVHADALPWLRGAGERFDVVVADLPDADSTETAKLYSVEFYGLATRVLADGGRLVVQAGSPAFATDAYWCIEASVAAAGLETVPYHVDVPSFGDWGFVLAGREAPALRLAEDGPDLATLDAPTLAAAAVFPPDRRPSGPVEPSTLLRPVVLEHQRGAWQGY